MCLWVWLLLGGVMRRWGDERRYMMWVYRGNRSHYDTTRTRSARLHLPKPWSPLSKHLPYQRQPVHTIRLMSERICLSSQLIWAQSCVVKREWVLYLSHQNLPRATVWGTNKASITGPYLNFIGICDSLQRRGSYQIQAGGAIACISKCFSVLLSEYTYTHTRSRLRYQHALVSQAVAQSSTTQWLHIRYSVESLLSPAGASLYYTIIWWSSLHATMARNFRCNIMWNLQVLWQFYVHQGILFSPFHTIRSFVLKYCACKNKKKSLQCISTPHALSH